MELDDSNEPQQAIPPKRRAALTGFFVSLVALIAVITMFNPGSGGPIVILFFLASVFIFSLSFASLTIKETSFRLFKKEHQSVHLFYFSILIATGVVFLVGLQTLGQLQAIDVMLVVIFEVLLNFYILRRF